LGVDQDKSQKKEKNKVANNGLNVQMLPLKPKPVQQAINFL